jgi:hypothetical protein
MEDEVAAGYVWRIARFKAIYSAASHPRLSSVIRAMTACEITQ